MDRRQKPIQVAIVEDRDETREGLARLIDTSPGFACVGRFASMEAALGKIEHNPPDILLTDIGLPGISGIEGVRRFLERFPKLQILMLTIYGDDEHVFEAICAGASGYLLKDTPPERLIASLAELAAGGAPMSPEIARKVVSMFTRYVPRSDTPSALTAREHELLVLLADGHSYKTAAKQLGLAIDTVRFYIRSIYDKLHVHSKSEAVAIALRRGILH